MPRQKTEESVSLFPFLDIMACLIGILVLLITAATLAQIARDEEDTKDAAAMERAEARVTEYRAIRDALTVEVKERKQLVQLVEQARITREQLEKLQAELARLEARQAAAQQPIEEIAEAKERIEELTRQLAELRTVLANRKEAAAESEIQIVPSGSGYGLSPSFVECASSTVVLHDRPEPLTIPIGQLSKSEAFQELLENVKQRPRGTVVFLVRPDGARSYNVARSIARRNYVTNGKLAVAGHGKLDLSLFNQK